jgi:hypothetical protein
MGVIKNWRYPQMWTFTLNPEAYPDRRRILEWIKHKRCVSTMIQSLWRKGVLNSRHFYAVMEFQDGSRNATGQATEQVHFHVLLDTKGFIDWAMVWELWERRAPPWRACGQVCDKHCPAMGFVRFDKVYEGEGLAAYMAKGVAGYLSKGVKNLPEWFVGYLDDGHNMQLKYASRGFFASLPKPERKYTRKQTVSKPGKRRKVSERIAACKHDADVYVVVSGQPLWVDRTAFDWETALERIAEGMTDEQLEHARKVGRVSITAAELIRVAGVDAYKRMLDRNEGLPVGLAAFSEMEERVLQKRGLRFHSSNALDAGGEVE